MNLKKKIYKIKRDDYLDYAIGKIVILGSAISLSHSFLTSLIPVKLESEDAWFNFGSIADDRCYFLNKALVKYRIHNSATHSRYTDIFNWLKNNLHV